MHFCLDGPWLTLHSFNCFLVAGVWKDTEDSSNVTILSNTARPFILTILMNAMLVFILSCFCSSVSSLGTHLAESFSRPRSS